MVGPTCLVMTPPLRELYNKVLNKYQEECKRAGVTEQMFLRWVETWLKDNNTQIAFGLPNVESLVSNVEKHRNIDGKSFKYIPEKVVYTPTGKAQQTYTIIGNKIFNKNGAEVFVENSKDRNKIFANFAVQQGRAVVVEHKGKKYVVNNKDQIISVQTGDIMKWGAENGDIKAILALSKAAFEAKQKAETATANTQVATETPKVEVFNGFWTREQVAQQQDKIFLFGDNTDDRVNTHYIPSSTQAVIRGLPNAVGIDTKKNRGTSAQSYFTDADFDRFKAQVDAALNWAKNDGRTIVIPADGIGTGKAMLKEKAPKCFEYLQLELQKLQNPTINLENNRLNNKKINYGNEFRRVQEESRKVGGISGRAATLTRDDKQRLAVLLRNELESQSSNNGRADGILKNERKGTSFGIRKDVSPILFHDFFEIVRTYTKNGELVDLHDDYSECKCYIGEDGTFGFAIEPNGNLVSVFNLGLQSGFLEAIKDYIIKEGATHLDAYNSEKQPLKEMYEKFLGAKATSSMDYNMEYDHDNIAKNHDNPDVVFMVLGKAAKKEIEEKHFSGDQYDDAVEWQMANVNISDEEISELAYQWTKDNIEKLVDDYIKENGNKIDPDKVRNIYGSYGYTGKNVPVFRKAEKYLVDAIFDRLLEKAVAEGKTSITFLTGVGGAGKSTALNNNKEIDLNNEGVIFDGAFNSYDSLTKKLEYAQQKGMKSVIVIAVHNDAETAFKNTVKRGKGPEGRFLSLQYFLDGAFRENADKIKRLATKHPEVKIITIDNSKNNGGKQVSLEEAFQWDYSISEELVYNLLNFIENEYKQGNLNAEQLSSIGAGIQEIGELTSERTQQIARRIDEQISQDARDKKAGNGSSRLGVGSFLGATGTPIDGLQQQPTQQTVTSDTAYGMSSSMEEAYQRLAVQKAANDLGENPSQNTAQSTSPAENKPKPEKPKSEAYESALKPDDSAIARFNRTFSPQQIKDRGAMIADKFSAIIDEALWDEMDKCLEVIESDTASEREKTQAKQRMNALRDPLKGRQLVVEEKGIPAIIEEILQSIKVDKEYSDKYTQDESERERKSILFQNTIDYFEELFNSQATLDIEEREGIRILDLKIAEQTASEDDNDAQNDGDDETGHYASGSDGWRYQVRFEDPFNALSKKVRSMLYDIERPASEKDDLGNTRKYPMGQIYASLLSYLAKNMQNADDFLQVDKSYEGKDNWGNDITEHTYPNGYPTFPVLEKMRNVYPWVGQLIQRLTDDYMNPDWNSNLRYPSTGGAMASQFYTNFRKAYIPYAKIQIGDGKFGVTPLNYEMEERVQYNKLEANYNNRMILSDHSVYNSDGTVNKNNTSWLGTQINYIVNNASSFYDVLQRMGNPDEEIDSDTQRRFNQFVNLSKTVLNSFGIDATQDSVIAYLNMEESGEALTGIMNSLSSVVRKIEKLEDSKVPTFNYILDLTDNYGRPFWNHFFDGRGMITDASYMQSFYDSASHKTKYSYSADNYLMKTFRGVCMGTLEERRKFIDKHFGKYEWFKNQKTGEWRNKWLEYWYNEPNEQKEIPYRNIDNITDYSKEETVIRPYIKWTEDDIWQVQNRSYEPEKYDKKTCFFLAPIFSDAPMSMTVKGPKMNMQQLLYGTNDTAGHHQGALVSLVNQELWRIGYVQRRAEEIKKGNIEAISNFDGKRGQQFCFLPELNTYQFEATDRYPAESFLSRMVRMKNEKATLSEIEAFQIQAITDIINAKMQEYLAENSKNYSSDNPLSPESYYNMVYANAAIIQMTTVDLAFYKDAIEFQKRFKEVYAGGIQLNTNSKYGKKTENVLLLADDIITSPSYNYIAAVIDGSNNLSSEDKEYIKSTFTEINVADAQAIRSMDSFRSVLDMMGKWDDRMEEALQHFRENKWNREDFDVIFQTIKPFVYAVIERNDGFGGSIPVPQQHKNSEICALMMYDLITNGLNDSPVYKALSRFMEDTVDSNGEHLIQMIQYESAGKVGNQGVINISFNPNKVIEILENGVTAGGKDLEFTTHWDKDKKTYLPNDVENAEENYKEIKARADYYLETGEMTQEEYKNLMQYLRPTEDEIIDILSQAALVTNPDGSKGINTEVVHTIPFDNYYQQQPTPEHHIDTEATFGSQARNINVADLPDDFEITVTGKKGSKKTFKGKDAIIDFYYELLDENLLEDFFGKGKKGGLKGVFASKESLRDAVTEIVRGNPKYGRDFADALQLDEKGNFILSPNSPTIFNLMQEIVTSFFKNRITKQKINGAALIQAAGIGLDENLRVVFDEKGKLLGAECLMPLTTRKFFEPLLEEKVINGEKVKVLSPEKLKKAGLDKAIGYRIPTENKSSMMPLIIKGFTPLQNGSSIVLPAEITDIAGSDFDVDKMFIMLMSFYIQTYDMRKAREAWANRQSIIKNLSEIFYNSDLTDEISEEDPEDFREWFEEHKDEFELETPRIHKVEYDFSKSPKENGRKARNNMLIQIMYNILVSKEGSESLFNPQGFADAERAAKIIRILTDDNLKRALQSNVERGVMPPAETIVSEFLSLVQEKYPEKYNAVKQAITKMTTAQIQQAYVQAITAGNNGEAINTLLSSSTKDLEKFIEQYSAPESPIYPQTFAHAHARNMAGTIQIGIYAIQSSMCAKYQRADVRLKEEQQYTINGRKITNVDVSDGGKRLKNSGQMVGASADNGKKPNLTDMGSTSKTAPIIGYMLRSGLSHLEASLIINQRHMGDSRYSSDNRAYWKEATGSKNPLSIKPDITTDMLVKSLISPFELTPEEDRQIAALCYRILMQHKAQEYLTQISRADSPNGAMQNSYAKARIQQYKVDLFQAKMGQNDFPFVRIKEALSNDAIDTSASEDVIREQLKGQKMAFLHGMYALGINSFNSLVSPYFFGATKHFDDTFVKPILYNLNESLSDAKKEDVVNKIYLSYITFMLSNAPLFGNEEGSTMKQKRDYYLESFPDDYIKTIQENQDIRDLLSTVLQVKNFGSRKRVVLQDVGSLSKGQKQDVQRRFESLLYSDNPVAQDLAKRLFIYSYFDNGLQFTNDSFSHLFTTSFLAKFSAYNEALLGLDTELSKEEAKNFIHQFLLTYPSVAYKVDSIISDDNLSPSRDKITIDLNDSNMRKKMINEVMSPNPASEGINVYPYISYGGEIYVLDQDMFEQYPGKPTYYKLPKYATYPRLPLFNSQMSVSEMAQEFPASEEAENLANTTIPEGGPVAYSEVTEDPSVDNSMNASFDAMDDFEPGYDPSDIEDVPESKSDTYSNEGNAELQKPMCG